MTSRRSPSHRRRDAAMLSRTWQSLRRSERLRRALCWLIGGYIHLVYRTQHWEIEGAERVHALRAQGRGFILAFWHGRLLMIPMAWQRLAPMHMLISAHRDGRIIAEAVRPFGVGSIAGSTRRGGSAALRAMVKRLKEGACVGITPDGPHGPAQSASRGIIDLARISGAPIVPITYATSRRWILSTWDRFLLPLPFGRGVYLWGEPLAVAPDLDEAGLEDARRLVETRMRALTVEADRRVHRSESLTPRLYRLLTGALAPLAPVLLRWRARRDKEDPARMAERRGIAGQPRPAGALVWVHAASVGEATAVLGLIERALAERPGLHCLLTTGTVTSARLLAERLPARARHQFAPLDFPTSVASFLDHWRPDLALWVESELWPNLVLATRARGIPAVLVNARLSARAAARWRCARSLIAAMLDAYALVLAQSAEQAERFRALGARRVASVGDLKAAAPPLPVDPAALHALRRQIADRPLWLAASTHAGEEEIAAAAHLALRSRHPGLLTILAPRHPARGAVIAVMLERQGLTVARRSRCEEIAAGTDIYLADTMGELGLFYRLCEIAFIGGSLVARGGHNPFEAARLDCAVLFGPDMGNCQALAETLLAAGGGARVTRDSLAGAVSALFDDPQRRATQSAAARAAAMAGTEVLDLVLGHLAPWLDPLAPSEPAAVPGRVPA
ncbi:MAG: glycosyltransferase N-terminal domain-containing protein [Stellaceae bacterium]